MRLTHEFSVPTDRHTAWRLLRDVRTIARCMPGADVETVDGDRFTGRMTVKLGPIRMSYAGDAQFTALDEHEGRMEITVAGRDSSGRGTARAAIGVVLRETAPARTTVTMESSLDVTGRPAQMGGALLSEVGERLVGQFADNLAGELETGVAPAPHGSAALDLAATIPRSGRALVAVASSLVAAIAIVQWARRR